MHEGEAEPLKPGPGDVIVATLADGGERRRYISADLIENYFWARRAKGHDNQDVPRQLRACLPARMFAPLGEGDTASEAIELDD